MKKIKIYTFIIMWREQEWGKEISGYRYVEDKEEETKRQKSENYWDCTKTEQQKGEEKWNESTHGKMLQKRENKDILKF